MSRRYSTSILCDYICRYCGNINKSFDTIGALSSRFSEKIVYCDVCQCDTINYKLGDKDLVKAELESYSELDGIQFEIWDLLHANDARKQLIKK